MTTKRTGHWNPLNKFSAEKVEQIRQGLARPNVNKRALADELGISICSLYRYARKLGVKLDPTRCRKQEGVEDMIRKYYPHYSSREIAEMQPEGIKLTKSRVLRWAKLLGVKHTPETEARIKEKYKRNLELSHVEECIQRRNAKRLRTIHMERFRLLSGMKPETKMNLRTAPDRIFGIGWYLENRYSYIRTTDPYIFWYDGDTRRTTKEYLYTKRYGFKFKAAQ